MAFHVKTPAMNQLEQQELPPNVSTPNNNATLAALGARLGLQSLNPSLLEQAVTHGDATNLTYLGNVLYIQHNNYKRNKTITKRKIKERTKHI